MRVRDIIKEGTLITVKPEQTMQEAADLMKQNHISGLPVIGPYGEMVGIVTLGHLVHLLQDGPDFASFLSSQEGWGAVKRTMFNGPWDKLQVSEVMSAQVVTVWVDDTIQNAARILLDASVHRAVVVDPAGRPLGMLSTLDFARILAHREEAQSL